MVARLTLDQLIKVRILVSQLQPPLLGRRFAARISVFPPCQSPCKPASTGQMKFSHAQNT